MLAYLDVDSVPDVDDVELGDLGDAGKPPDVSEEGEELSSGDRIE